MLFTAIHATDHRPSPRLHIYAPEVHGGNHQTTEINGRNHQPNTSHNLDTLRIKRTEQTQKKTSLFKRLVSCGRSDPTESKTPRIVIQNRTGNPASAHNDRFSSLLEQSQTGQRTGQRREMQSILPNPAAPVHEQRYRAHSYALPPAEFLSTLSVERRHADWPFTQGEPVRQAHPFTSINGQTPIEGMNFDRSLPAARNPQDDDSPRLSLVSPYRVSDFRSPIMSPTSPKAPGPAAARKPQMQQGRRGFMSPPPTPVIHTQSAELMGNAAPLTASNNSSPQHRSGLMSPPPTPTIRIGAELRISPSPLTSSNKPFRLSPQHGEWLHQTSASSPNGKGMTSSTSPIMGRPIRYPSFLGVETPNSSPIQGVKPGYESPVQRVVELSQRAPYIPPAQRILLSYASPSRKDVGSPKNLAAQPNAQEKRCQKPIYFQDDSGQKVYGKLELPSIDRTAIPDLQKFKESVRTISPLKSGDFMLYGQNSTETILQIQTLGGKSIQELEYKLRPGGEIDQSFAGFIGKDESFLKRLALDNRLIATTPYRHQDLGRALRFIDAMYQQNRMTKFHEGDVPQRDKRAFAPQYYFTFGDTSFLLTRRITPGFQPSPFGDDARTNITYTVKNLSNDQVLEFSGLIPHFVEKYGFYEGNTSYRVEPKHIIRVLEPIIEGLKG